MTDADLGRRLDMPRELCVFVLVLLGSTILNLAAGRSLLAQAPGHTLLGTVRTKTGAPVAGAIVSSDGLRSSADSLGRFTLTGLSGARVRVSVRWIGFERLDTTIVLPADQAARLDAVLERQSLESSRDADAAAEAKNVAAGRIDSSALGLVRRVTPASAPPLTFGVFGARLLGFVGSVVHPEY